MNRALWIAQIVLALLFLITGGLKLALPPVAARLGREHGLSPYVMRVIGLLEVLGALGVVLPAWTGILPWLTPLAAAGLLLTMIGAAFENVRLEHHPVILVNLVLALLAVFVVYSSVSSRPVSRGTCAARHRALTQPSRIRHEPGLPVLVD